MLRALSRFLCHHLLVAWVSIWPLRDTVCTAYPCVCQRMVWHLLILAFCLASFWQPKPRSCWSPDCMPIQSCAESSSAIHIEGRHWSDHAKSWVCANVLGPGKFYPYAGQHQDKIRRQNAGQHFAVWLWSCCASVMTTDQLVWFVPFLQPCVSQ